MRRVVAEWVGSVDLVAPAWHGSVVPRPRFRPLSLPTLSKTAPPAAPWNANGSASSVSDGGDRFLNKMCRRDVMLLFSLAKLVGVVPTV